MILPLPFFLSRLNPYPFRFILAKETSGYCLKGQSTDHVLRSTRESKHISALPALIMASHTKPRLAVEAPHTWKRWSTDWALGAVWSCSELLCQRTASLLLGILAFWSKWYAHDISTFWCGRFGWGSDQWWVEQLDHGSIRWPVNLKLWGHGAKSEDLAPSFATDDLKRPGNKMLECYCRGCFY